MTEPQRTPGVCFFGSANDAVPDSAKQAAAALGRGCAEAGWRLVYGGSRRGLMGAAAGAAMEAGGQVIGVMPRGLVNRERADAGITELHVVDSLAERKQLMADLSDLFVALPGGVGTLDEVLEMMTWFDIGLHRKPTFLCNVDGFWDPFMALMERFRSYHVLRPGIDATYRLMPDVDCTLEAIGAHFATV